jgi:hypothetical protein
MHARLVTDRLYGGVAGLAVRLLFTAHPARAAGVVGDGTPASCTEAVLDSALSAGGSVTFDCGTSPGTITVTSTKTISADTTIDGGSLITISGGNSVGVFSVNAGVNFTVENLTVINGHYFPAVGGNFTVVGGIYNNGTLTVTNSTFSNNVPGTSFGGGIYNGTGG